MQPIYVYGEDTYRAWEEIRGIADKHRAQIRFLDVQDLKEKPLAQWLEGSRGLFGKQMVVVRDVARAPKSVAESIQAAAEAGGEAIWILWDHEVPDKHSALFRLLKKKSRHFAYRSPGAAARWLQEEARKLSGTILPDAARTLVERVGVDSWRLMSELNKLLLVANMVTVQAVEQHVDAAEPVEEVFALLDAMASGNQRIGMSVMEHLLAGGASELYILSMLAYQFRMLFLIASGRTRGLHPFVVRKNETIARRFSPAQLAERLTRVAATDFAIKQGRVDARTGLAMLLVRS